ncbi:MAG: flagellar biosynthetic protein FliR [Lysobacteraceae bacterium]
MSQTSSLELLAGGLALSFIRYAPAIVLPAYTPLRWAPGMVRIVLATGLAWLTVLSAGEDALRSMPHDIGGWIRAGLGECMIGIVFGLALMIPQAALHSAGWLLDVQAGLGSATLFNPGMEGDPQSLLGTAVSLVAIVLFFALDLHLDLYRGLVASVQWLPLGAAAARPDVEAFFGLLGNGFLLALSVIAPVMLGLFALDVSVAYATRSMPQANVYFLVLPLKVLVALLLFAASLRFAPELLSRLYRDAFSRVPGLIGG